MADFLTRLASRTLGLAPMAEPVVAPLFAPDPSLPEIAGSDEALDASQAVEPAVTRDALPPLSSPTDMVRPVAPRSRPDLIEWPALLATEARTAPPSAGETTSRAATAASDVASVGDLPTRRRPPLSPVTASESADEDALLIPAAGGPERRSPVRPSTPTTGTPGETRSPARPDSYNSLHRPTPWTEEPVAASGRSAERQGGVAPPSWDAGPDEPLLLPLTPAKAREMRRDARAAAVVTPADEPEPSQRAERGPASATSSSPPTIEVTIGRVEVRAVHPPTPVARPKPAAPVAPRLSLEEYLRNQNGGRR